VLIAHAHQLDRGADENDSGDRHSNKDLGAAPPEQRYGKSDND
jgi:hypothetical protein